MVESTPITLMVIVLSCGYISSQVTVPDEVVISTDATTAVTHVNTEGTGSEGTDVMPSNCTNGKGLAGGCVERMYCTYNTTNIDLSLYGPPEYRNPCVGKYICCPLEYVLQTSPAVNTESEEFNFGDDDEN